MRSLAHIGQEILELFPSFADQDSTTTIILKLMKARIGTSCHHCAPREVCRGFHSAPLMAVAKMRLSLYVSPETPTAFRGSVGQSESESPDGHRVATVAFT